MTLRLTETRGSRSWPAFAHASRKSSICSACSSSNGTCVSSRSSVELIRFMPCSPAQTAVSREPEPHQMRSARPGDCGWTASIAVARPAADVGADDAARRRSRRGRARLLARLVGVDRVAERLGAAPGRLRRAAADAELEPAAGQQIGRRRVLGHVERVLVAHVDHAGADLDPARLDADRGEQRERRGELAREVVDADERAVDPDLLGGDRELDRLAERVAAGVRQTAARVPGAEREEADLLGIRHLPGKANEARRS